MYSNPHDWSLQDLRILKALCANSTLATARMFFKLRDGSRFIVSPHHRVLANTLDRVSNGEIKRLIINIPPGYTKTELAVVFFVLKSYIANPKCRFIHGSYSSELATRNSAIIRNLTQTPMYQALTGFEKREDQWQKSKWANTDGGEFRAVSSRGQVTGFRAGDMDKSCFGGAVLIDDPIKPYDALSIVDREKINFNFDNTFRSRLAQEDVPIIIIMQRVHDLDLSGYLLTGGRDKTGSEKWHHLKIPAKITEASKEYNQKKYTHGIPIPVNLPLGPIWPFKHSDTELRIVEKSNTFVWSCQYLQEPADPSTSIFKRQWFGTWDYTTGFDKINSRLKHNGQWVQIRSLSVFGDTAMKTGRLNDYTVFQLWGLGENGKIYKLDRIRGKWEAPELEEMVIEFLNRWSFKRGVSNVGIKEIFIEDKASGTGLIQSLNKAILGGVLGCPKITPLQRHIDKAARAYSCQSAVERGCAVIPDSAPWKDEYLQEIEEFNANLTHAHDDQVDPTMDALQNLIVEKVNNGYYNIIED